MLKLEKSLEHENFNSATKGEVLIPLEDKNYGSFQSPSYSYE